MIRPHAANMFRPLIHSLKGARPTTVRPFSICVTASVTVLAHPYAQSARPPRRFTPIPATSLRPGTLNNSHRGDCNPTCKRRLCMFCCGAFITFHWVKPDSSITAVIKLESDKSAQSVSQTSTPVEHRLTPSLLPVFRDEYVPIEYAVDALFEDVKPDRSRPWCQQLILADLSRKLAVQRHRETYICKKSCVDDLDWKDWWKNWTEGYSDEASELSFESNGTTLVDDDEEDEGSNDGSVGSLD